MATRIASLSLLVAAAALSAGVAARTMFADDSAPPVAPVAPVTPKGCTKPGDSARPASATGRAIVFEGGLARFDVVRDPIDGTMTFRLADRTVRMTDAPIFVLQTDQGPKEFTLTPVAAESDAWFVKHDLLKADRIDGTMKIVLAGKTYSAAVAADRAASKPAPRPDHHGRVVMFDACGTYVEVVQDVGAGTVTLYSFEGALLADAPVVTVWGTTPAVVVVATKVDGQPGAWIASHAAFKSKQLTGNVRLGGSERVCEASLRGGRFVSVVGGPTLEIVAGDQPGTYTVYALDERVDGKEYVLENPEVVIATSDGPRTVRLTRIDAESRAWRFATADVKAAEPFDGQLRFTVLGRPVDARLGATELGLERK
jgi:hypothetical protein